MIPRLPTEGIIVVEDHAVVRHTICGLLSHESLDIVCQTAFGEEAVREAGELKPDLEFSAEPISR
jgi:DNA-binding NarL/FixJ family response regulator